MNSIFMGPFFIIFLELMGGCLMCGFLYVMATKISDLKEEQFINELKAAFKENFGSEDVDIN